MFRQVSSDKRKSQNDPSDMTLFSHHSLDDEFTPGVFKLFNWCTTSNTDKYSEDDGSIGLDKSKSYNYTLGFVQWKPIAYAAEVSSLSCSTVSNYSSLLLLFGLSCN